ncbi:hypothetical protein LCGC14_1755270 [marine sediment metagenome]|uniref:Uncharacterized protein n=1 Tax=marine sediment metagenome TaxID=412755 RepID=A0A0F9HQ33_9ZZZZ
MNDQYRCGKFKTGDRGQRYEVTYFDPQTKSRRVFGWASEPTVTNKMCDSIHKHPTWRDAKIRDRDCPHDHIYPSTGKCRSCGEVVS